MRNQRGFTLKEFAVFLLLIAGVLTLFSDVIPLRMSEARATSALESSGARNVQLGGIAFLGCKGDKFRRKFTATNAEGRPIKGVVCGGWWSDDTIRYN